MTQVLIKILEQLNSSVFVLLGICFIAAVGLYRIGKLVEKFTHHDKKIDRLSNLSESVIELRTKIDLIYLNTNRNSPIMSRSPISLTPIGEEIVTNVSASAMLEKYFAQLEAEVDKCKPSNAYDIQMTAMDVVKTKMLKMLDDREITSLKQEAYNRGSLVEDIMLVFGVLLRNKILNKRGMPVSDVDKHAETGESVTYKVRPKP